MGNKQAKQVSTELTDKRKLFQIHSSKIFIIIILEIALLKANTKYSEKGRDFHNY